MASILAKSKELALIVPFTLRVFPQVNRELAGWRKLAAAIPCPQLRTQALNSIVHKRFHCQGGSIYSVYTPEKKSVLLRFIVALQTISDYLDNLSDRVPGTNEKSLRTLHQAILAAVDLNEPFCFWYEDYPYQNDGGYLNHLVQTCRQALSELAGYNDIRQNMRRLVELYADLQVYKHLEINVRVEKLVSWFNRQNSSQTDVYWWEFAAACGSTLGVFMLAAMAAAGPVSPKEISQLLSCYFPWLCGLHILLDYFIDLDEDKDFNDLNFVNFYPTALAAEKGLLRFLEETLTRVKKLPRPAFHFTVSIGLLALYLSDPKAFQHGCKKTVQQLLHFAGAEARWLHRFCLYLRKGGVI
ncbi:MAG: tetraprenyl-beta-curcumene synthase family protein [Firmicutes bacterium]|nr:tetraprenyl-beta-curcumene synthase family protein [Bacillota bacterium]